MEDFGVGIVFHADRFAGAVREDEVGRLIGPSLEGFGFVSDAGGLDLDALGEFVFVFGIFIDGHVHDDGDGAIGSHDFGALVVESFVGFDVGVVGVFFVEKFKGQAMQLENGRVVGEAEGSGIEPDDGAIRLWIVFIVSPTLRGDAIFGGFKGDRRRAEFVRVGTADGVGDTDENGDEDDGES